MPPLNSPHPNSQSICVYRPNEDESFEWSSGKWDNSTIVVLVENLTPFIQTTRAKQNSTHSITTHHQSAALRETIARLDRLSELEDNWDDEGAECVELGSIERARRFVEDREKEGLDPYFVVAGKQGEVILEYRKDTISIEVEFYGNPSEPQRLIIFDASTLVYDDVFDYAKFFGFLGLVSKIQGGAPM